MWKIVKLLQIIQMILLKNYKFESQTKTAIADGFLIHLGPDLGGSWLLLIL